MKNYQSYSLLILVMFLIGCQSSDKLSTTTRVAPSLSITSIENPQTPTYTLPVIVTPTVSAQLLPENVLKYDCLEIITNIPRDTNLTGKLILDGVQPYFYNFEDRALQAIPDNRGDFAVSPDGKWLAYYEISSDSTIPKWLTVENAEGQKKRVPMQEDWFWGAGL
jgi:hypothetical protein